MGQTARRTGGHLGATGTGTSSKSIRKHPEASGRRLQQPAHATTMFLGAFGQRKHLLCRRFAQTHTI